MKTKTISLLLIAGMILCISSCKTNEDQDENTEESTTEVLIESPTENHMHQFDGGTCTEPAKCSCGLSSGYTRGHDWIDATCTTAKTCYVCGAVGGVELGHNYASATCTTAQICKRCENVDGSVLGHDYAEATCLTPKTCSRCQETEGDPLGHTYANDMCIRCSQVDPETLPVPLEEIYVIDSNRYGIEPMITDSYGCVHHNVHYYYNGGYSVHNLDGKYSTFSGSIIIPNNHQGNVSIQIYVDNILKFTLDNTSKETQKTDFEIDVKNAIKLKIVTVASNVSSVSSSYANIGVTNAQLTK